MNRLSSPKLGSAEVLELIEKARHTELCRDIETLQYLLQDVWNDFEKNPDFKLYPPAIQAELFRLSGVYLSFKGFAGNLKNYQERGKDLLTNSIELFQSLNLVNKEAEARVMLAFCYWNAGEINECRDILDYVEEEIGKDLFNPVYIQISLNRLLIHFFNNESEKAVKLIEEIETAVEFCSDIRLHSMFHNQAGIFFTNTNEHQKAFFHLKKAAAYAKQSNNLFFVAINYNNLAFLHKQRKEFIEAVEVIRLSIKAFEKIGNIGFLPHALDTEALIYLDFDRPEIALRVIEEAIELFRTGEDYRGLCDGLWTKTICHLKLNQMESSLSVFSELIQIARSRIGQIAVEKFTREMSAKVYGLQNLPILEEVNVFKKSRVKNALIESNLKIADAARALGLKSHQTLSNIIKTQFPELIDELNLPQRAKRKDHRTKEKSITLLKSEIRNEVYRAVFSNQTLLYETPQAMSGMENYYLPADLMKNFGINFDAYVVVVPILEFKEGLNILISFDEKFIAGRLQFDRQFGFFFVNDENGFPVPLDGDAITIVGSPIEYTRAEEAEKRIIKFSKLG